MSKPLVLTVDDDATIRNIIKTVLTKNGYDVLVAESGEAALECLKVNKPDLVLLDLNMGGMDGYETCTLIQKANPDTYIPVIFVTASDEEQNKAKALSV